MAEIGRLMTAMITPFDGRGRVNYEEAKRLALALVNSGNDGLVLSGSTGESPTLSRDEKLRLYSEVKGAVGDRAAIIAGTTTSDNMESVELSKEAERLPIDGLMLTVPSYNKPTQEGLYQHLKSVAESVHLPCILYNVPSRTSLNMAHETTVRLSRVGNIIGVKEASSDFDQITRIIRDTDEDFRVWSGNDYDTFFIMSMGGYGVVSVLGHLVARQIKSMMGMILEGDIESAAAEHRRLLDLFKSMFIVSNPIPVKYSVGKAGFNVGKPRLPLTPPDEVTAAKIDAVLAKHTIDLVAPMPADG